MNVKIGDEIEVVTHNSVMAGKRDGQTGTVIDTAIGTDQDGYLLVTIVARFGEAQNVARPENCAEFRIYGNPSRVNDIFMVG